jgi:transcriptional regulator with XRE-family HTH domain
VKVHTTGFKSKNGNSEGKTQMQQKIEARRFGDVVRQRRLHLNMELKTLAHNLGVSSAYWSRIERNMENPPKDALIKAAAMVIGLDLDTAFTSAGRLPPDLRSQLRDVVAFARSQSVSFR